MTRDDARRILVAYDVTEDCRRDQLAKCLQRYGDRVQYSVFVIDASPARIARLKHEVVEIIHGDSDSVLLCDLGLVGRVKGPRLVVMGRKRPMTGAGPTII